MFLPETGKQAQLIAGYLPAATARPVPAMPQTAGMTPQFSALYRQTQDEVLAYIGNGSAGLSGLSAEGAWLHRRVAMPEAAAAPVSVTSINEEASGFVASILPYARQAAARLGVAPEIVAAHAALESDWGRRPILRGDGSHSFNLFGIKAGAGWAGDSARTPTTEFLAGQSVRRVESFRAYPGYEAAFDDYARLLSSNPRYRGALGAGSDAAAFARSLASGGYATDPDYARKLTRVVDSVRLRQAQLTAPEALPHLAG
ncbi:glycoside hydrolase family 73 protein [Craterilacuibacter sp.]|uniref:glycoside hydrolase family 73 protein n=1 Tax=Craterilacuibacter sp. TaxID=2870909 RepID=UPI003F337E3B